MRNKNPVCTQIVVETSLEGVMEVFHQTIDVGRKEKPVVWEKNLGSIDERIVESDQGFDYFYSAKPHDHLKVEKLNLTYTQAIAYLLNPSN